MTCVHLKELYHLVEKFDIKLGSSDLIRITCPQCGVQETCPAKHMDEFPEASEDPAPKSSDQKQTQLDA